MLRGHLSPFWSHEWPHPPCPLSPGPQTSCGCLFPASFREPAQSSHHSQGPWQHPAGTARACTPGWARIHCLSLLRAHVYPRAFNLLCSVLQTQAHSRRSINAWGKQRGQGQRPTRRAGLTLVAPAQVPVAAPPTGSAPPKPWPGSPPVAWWPHPPVGRDLGLPTNHGAASFPALTPQPSPAQRPCKGQAADT